MWRDADSCHIFYRTYPIQKSCFLAIFIDLYAYLMKNLKSYRVFAGALLACMPFTMFAKNIDDAIVKKATSGPGVFVENKGQVVDQNNTYRSDIDFKYKAANVDVFVGDATMHYQWMKSEADGKINTYRMDVELIGANVNAPYTTTEQGAYHENYYTERFPGGLSVNSFKKIVYTNVYPNIDWVLYTADKDGAKMLKYDFVVKPGGNPANIKLRYSGATSLSVDNGALTAMTPMGSITENKPYTYDAVSKAEVTSGFVLNDNILSFDVAAHSGTLVIDPEVQWKTYMGGTGTDHVMGIAADAVSNGYVVGWTISTTLATFGSHQYTFGGGSQDGYLIKFNPEGVTDWATFYGGSGSDMLNNVAVDNSGNVIVVGQTNSTGAIAPSGAHQFTFGGAQDGFLAKFTSTGTRSWASYYGGSGEDNAYAVACDATGNIFIAGSTQSTTGIASSNATRTTPAKGFLAKFNAAGSRQWGTYAADTGQGAIRAIACDIKGNVYCVGYTNSYQNIATPGSHQTANGGGTVGPLHTQDGFLAKYNTNGGRVWATYYGGNNLDEVTSVDCDDNGSIYIGGITWSTNGTTIATSGTYQSSYSPSGPDQQSGFLAKFSESGVRQWGSYINSGWTDYLTDLTVMPGGRVFVTGFRDLNVSSPPPPYTYVARFSDKGLATWQYDHVTNYPSAQLAYGDGKLYFAGTMFSPDSATLTTNLVGPSDAFVVRFSVDTVVFIKQPFGDSTFCVGDTLKVPYDVSNKFNSGNVFRLQMSDVGGNFSNSTILTSLTTDTGGMFKYIIPNTITEGKGYKLRLVGTTPIDTSYDNIYEIRVSHYPNVKPTVQDPVCANGQLTLGDTGSSPSTTVFTFTGPGGFSIGTNSYPRPNVQITDSGWYVLTGDNYGCIDIDSAHATIIPKPAKPVFTTNSPVCEGDTLRIKASSPGISSFIFAFYRGSSTIPVWFFNPSGGDTTIVAAALSDTGRYVVTSLMNDCPSDPETTKVVVNPTVIPTVQINASPGNFIGPWQSVTFNITGSSNTGTAPVYQWMRNGTDIPGANGTTFVGTTGIDLQTGDTICLRMTGNAQCSKPTVVRSCVGIEIDLGVDDPALANRYQLFPNPNNGRFTLQSGVAFKGEEVIVTNSLGQEVYRGIAVKGSTKADIDLGIMPRGMYLLRTTADGKPVSIKFTISE